MGIEAEFTRALERAHRDALIATVRGRPEMTLADLAKLSRKNGLSSVTVGELLRGSGLHGGPGGRSPSSRARTSAADTRTPAARERYDRSVLDALAAHGDWINAQDVRDRVGGTPLQARKALNRLVERGMITWRGKARGTRYRSLPGGRAKASPPSNGKSRGGSSTKVDTRTPSARANYDQTILSTLSRDADTGAEQLRTIVGGTPTQLRKSLHRLVAAGKVTTRGRARATKYRAK